MKYGVVGLLLVLAMVCGCPKDVVVPDVSGMSLESAQAALSTAGLAVGLVSYQFSATVAAGIVISQNPGAEASVAPDTAVDLAVSLGPEPAGPDASFSAAPVEGDAPLTVVFTDTSAAGTSSITSWAWDFGDGASSAEVNPRHVYADAGTYTATLTVATSVGSDTASTAITVRVHPVGPSASFTASPTRGALPLEVTFTNTSTAGTSSIASWAWDFGDGASSAEQHPAHTYANAGTYTVSLVVATSVSSDTAIETGLIVVDKATPVVSAWPSAGSLVYGQTLASSALTGGTASVAGTFVYEAPSTTPGAGTFVAAVRFVPANSANYSVVAGSVQVHVAKAEPVVTAWPSAGAIVYGQALRASGLAGGAASAPGTFVFDAPEATPPAGAYAAAVSFVPSDTTNYNGVAGSVNVEVARATPEVTDWPAASAITYGQTLAASTLVGGAASVSGTFAFDAPTTAPNAGTLAAAVTFSPADSANYETVSGTVEVVVSKTTPSVTAWPVASAIVYGQALSASMLTGGTTSIPGTFAFDAPATVPDAGTYSAAVTFVPVDTANYESMSGTVAVVVNKATPSVVDWPTASAITFGQRLEASALTGGAASVLGTFAFDAPATAPNAGVYSAAVTFAPTDTANYETVSGAVIVNVAKATPSVTAWPMASSIVYGQTLEASTLTGGTASVPGTFAFDAPATAPSSGTYTAAVTFTPSDTGNYEKITGTVDVPVSKARPAVTAWPAAAAITYGETLASSALTGGAASVPGAFAFEAAATMPDAGAYAAAVTFTPADIDNFEAVSGTVSVVVQKAAPVVASWPSASAITYGETLVSSILTGGEASVPGTFAFDDPSVAPDAGLYHAFVLFTPADSVNYTEILGVVGVTVIQATPEVTEWPAASPILVGQALSQSTLTGGVASIPGTFAFEDPDTVPEAGMYEAAVRFVPDDQANFSSVPGTVTVEVKGGVPTAAFEAAPVSGPAPLSVVFTDVSIENGDPITTWVWDFGDGSTSEEQNPAHVYEHPGVYTVSLTVNTLTHSDTAMKEDYITVAPQAGSVFYVKPDGAGDGASWETASGSIQDAVDAAAAAGGAEVWVASGAYTATLDALAKADTTYVVRMAEGVDLYGGFSGTEIDREARDWEANPSIIDGEDTYPCVYGAGNATLDGFIIQHGRAAAQGGGMLNSYASPAIVHCAFVRNKAGSGAGMYNHHADPTVEECSFIENEQSGMANAASRPTVIGCRFVRNKAESGGGILNNNLSYPYFERCVLFENFAIRGGGSCNIYFGSSRFVNCTFLANRAQTGIALYNVVYSESPLWNCICWDDASLPNTEEIYEEGPLPGSSVMYSCIRGGHEGEGNIDADPQLAGTEGSQGRVFPTSPCINAGAVLPDWKGGPAPKTGAVDIGAYELDDSDGDGMSDTWEMAYFGDLSAGPDDDPDGDGLTNVGESVYGTDPLAADTDGDGIQDGDELPLGWDPVLPTVVRRVDADNVSGGHDGQSWASAFVSIQDAVDEVHATGEGEVWVAAGTYRSGVESATLRALSAANNAYVVAMAADVYLYGGFNATETRRDQRDWRANPSVIDGEEVRGGVYGANHSTLDGFVIEHGNVTTARSGDWYGDMGAGLHSDLAMMRVANCTFRDNTSYAGGALFAYLCSETVSNCVFAANSGEVAGGAIMNYFSPSTLTNCVFAENMVSVSGLGGGAIFDYSEPTYGFGYSGLIAGSSGLGYDGAFHTTVQAINCTFTRNQGYYGGAIVTYGSSAELTNSILWRDSSYDGREIAVFAGTDRIAVAHSCIYGGYVGAGNIATDPLFVDPLNGKYTLAAESPCIDTGTPEGAPAADVLGVARPQGLGYDMGAYESRYTGGTLDANFTASGTRGVLPYAVTFSDLSVTVRPIERWQWDFGDGATSTDQNPSHTYDRGGAYTVSLTVYTATSSDTETRTGYITVDRITPAVSVWPMASPIAYGQRLSESELSDGAASVIGVFRFANPDYVPNVGTYSAAVVFTPYDIDTYKPVNGTVSVTVGKATPVITTWPTAGTIVYGQRLSSSTLAGGAASVPGDFAYAAPSAILSAGTNPASVVFTPTDHAHFNSVNGAVLVTVEEAVPIVLEWPSASSIAYGQRLSASTLTGGSASVPGTFVFDHPDVVPEAGSYTEAVTFTPDDSANYASVSGRVTVVVAKAIPSVFVWPSASPITLGQPLSASDLTGGSASVPGTFAFDHPEATPGEGAYTAAVTFVPADSANYVSVSGHATVVVAKAIPSVSEWPAARSIIYGDSLSYSVLSGGTASVAGSFVFANPDVRPDAGNYSAEVTFVPDDSATYAPVSGRVLVHVGKATPSVTTPPVASSIVYGQTLASSTLSGGVASVPGIFAFSVPSTAPSRGLFNTQVTFSPTDGDRYNSVVMSVSVTVNQAVPQIASWPTASAIVYGQTLASSTLEGGTPSVPGVFSFVSPDTLPRAGTYKAAIRFQPDESANYLEVIAEIPIVVNRDLPAVSQWPTATSIVYGQALSSSTLNGGAASVAGSFAFDAPALVPNRGTYLAAVTFTPSDIGDFLPVSGSAAVLVEKASPIVYVWPDGAPIFYGQTLADSQLSSGSASVPGTFTFDLPSFTPVVGRYPAAATFTPANTFDYLPVFGVIQVPVYKLTPLVSEWPSASPVMFGGTVSASELTGGAASVAGTFVFSDPGVKLAAGTHPVSVTFIPEDEANYLSVVGAVDIFVSDTWHVVLGATGTGISWSDAKGTIQAAVDEAHLAGGGQVWVAADTYTHTKGAAVVTMYSQVHLYGGFAGTETSLDERDWNRNATILDGQGRYYGVVGDNEATLDGFTVRNGSADQGGGMINQGVSPTVANCSFTMNSARLDGGGMYNASSSVIVRNCVFSHNTSDTIALGYYGGGMYCSGATPTVVQCTFVGNAGYLGGGLYIGGSTNLALSECVFRDNKANSGGGIYVGGSVNMALSESVFRDNEAYSGGGIYLQSAGNSQLSNCVFAFNKASYAGGGVYQSTYAFSSLVNCTFCRNTGSWYGGGIYINTGAPTITNCIFWNDTAFSSATSPEIENHDSVHEPTVAYSCVSGGHVGTGNIALDPKLRSPSTGSYGLRSGSPCIDTGVAGATDVDVRGVARPQGGGIDMGASELDDTDGDGMEDLWEQTHFLGLGSQPGDDPDGDGLNNLAESVLGTDPNEQDSDGDGVSDVKEIEEGLSPVASTLVRRVDSKNLGRPADGLTWQTAFGRIDSAVNSLTEFDEAVIWVAAGTYSPGSGSIVMRRHVNLYGGFAGTEDSLDQRDPAANPTAIDAQAGGRCVTGADEAVLDGFTLRNGKTTSGDGAGMYNAAVSPTVRNCIFSRNVAAGNGGGMANDHSQAAVIDCVFTENSSGTATIPPDGGGMYNAYASISIAGCTFSNNVSDGDGGGVANYDATVNASDCGFDANYARDGGAVDSDLSTVTLARCVLSGNTSESYGGGLRDVSGQLNLTNCVLCANVSDSRGGGLHLNSTTATVLHCTFNGNTASRDAGAIYSAIAVLTVKSSILWGDTDSGGHEIVAESNSFQTYPRITYSCIDGGFSGTGNTSSDPLFVDASILDYHLLLGSTCIDAAPVSGAPATDIEGTARPQGAGFDMGAYEFVPGK